jgi:chemotaxis protein MotB
VLKPHEKHEQAIVKRAARKYDDDAAGGAWKVAFADFCLALMALFLVLWLMASRDRQSLQATQHAGLGSGEDPALTEPAPAHHNGPGTGKGTAKAQPSMASPAELEALSRALAAISAQAGLTSNLEAVNTPFGLRVTLHDTDGIGMFERGSAIPTPRFSALLRKMGPLFARIDNQMLVVGHTDSLPYTDGGTGQSGYSNWTLSSGRAMAARAALLGGGMGAGSVLQVVGMADRAPRDSRAPTAAINRRIDMLILTRGQARQVASMFGMAGEPPGPSAAAVTP